VRESWKTITSQHLPYVVSVDDESGALLG
jgi:hypothetical protein